MNTETIEKETATDVYTLLGVVCLAEIAPYNEYDHALNGGYFNCPDCDKQQYIEKAEVGDKDECSECNKQYVFE
jgi:hypothetical protein